MTNLFAFRLPSFITRNPYVIKGVIVALFAFQFYQFYTLYKTTRLKTWNQLKNSDKLYKIHETVSPTIYSLVLYICLIETGDLFLVLLPFMVIYVFFNRYATRQVERINNLLTKDGED